jgi:hypothetical protein
VETADHCVHLVGAGELAGVAHGVDHSSVAAARHDDQALATYVGDQGLIVVDERVGLPIPVTKGFMEWEPRLEFRGALDLPGHQEAAIQEGRGLPSLDHLEAGGADLLLAGRGQLVGLLPGDGDPPSQPEVGMDDHPRPRRGSLRQAVEARCVVEVTVA